MLRPDVTKSILALSLFSLASLSSSGVARAAGDGDRCTLHGDVDVAPSVGIFDAPSDGIEIGHFTGAKVTLTVLSFAEGAGGRSLVETSGFRLKGFVRSRDVPAYTTRPVPVYGSHVSIAEGRRVAVIGAGSGRLRVERAASAPLSGAFQGWAPCEAVSLAPRVPSGWAPPSAARGYLVVRQKVDLFDRAKGAVVVTLTRAPDGVGIPFWGSDSADGFVHVEHHGDVVIDAWARLRDLTPLAAGETPSPPAPAAIQTVVQKPQLQGRAKIVRTTSAVPLRAAATDAAVAIGGIDAGVDVIVVDVVAGWVSVMPVNQGLAPSGAAQFWVHARDLGV
ncbi:MAG TPA: hypothetical protein VH062_20260 [Polyangiaceae bacterium]|jgi:hypothetical protein|nr:hypothetical protein [Polyangiaceae bacterium]